MWFGAVSWGVVAPTGSQDTQERPSVSVLILKLVQGGGGAPGWGVDPGPEVVAEGKAAPCLARTRLRL